MHVSDCPKTAPAVCSDVFEQVQATYLHYLPYGIDMNVQLQWDGR